MKKFMILLVVVALVLAFASVSFAHPATPEQSIQKVNANAAHGMHTAWFNVQNANGRAAHVFAKRHSPHR